MSTVSEIRDRSSAVSDLPLRPRHLPSALCPLPPAPQIALLTGGGDKPYALGLTTALTSAGVIVDFIGSDHHVVRELLANPRVNFHNLRGPQRPQVSRVRKVLRVLNYYFRLICYAAKAKPAIFH